MTQRPKIDQEKTSAILGTPLDRCPEQSLNQFELLVKRGEISLHDAPQELFAEQPKVGDVVSLTESHPAVTAVNEHKIYTHDLRTAATGEYQITHIGTVDTIVFRDPNSNKNTITTSNKIRFIIIKWKNQSSNSPIAFRDPRY